LVDSSLGPAPVPGIPEESWADVGELRVRYLDWGGDGPPVLALHGLASSGNWYERVAARLSPSYRIIAPDQRGHGRTTQAPNGYDWETLARDLTGLLDHLELNRVAVLGHSWGGHVATNLAARFPQRVSRVVLIDGGYQNGRLLPDATEESFRARLGPRNVSGDRAEFLDRLRIQLAECWGEDLERIVQTMVYADEEGQIRDILHPDHHAQVLTAMWNEPPSEIIPQISCPILIVPAGPKADRADTGFSRTREMMVAAAAEVAKQVRVRWIPETIHDIGYHKPQELAQVIQEFLEEE